MCQDVFFLELCRWPWGLVHETTYSSGLITSLKTNISPENQWLADVFPIEIIPFYGTFVSFREGR